MIEVPLDTLLHEINRLLTLKCRNLLEPVFQIFRREEIQAQRQRRFPGRSYPHAPGPRIMVCLGDLGIVPALGVLTDIVVALEDPVGRSKSSCRCPPAPFPIG